MGNNLSSGGDSNGRQSNLGSSQEASASTSPLLPLLRRTTGSLGLTKSELDKRCKPSGLYATCSWDERSIRREIGDGRLAARLVGGEVSSSSNNIECPICFLSYSQVNQTSCCKAHICTECFLQVRPQHEITECPFCNSNPLSVSIAAFKSENRENIGSEAINEDRVDDGKRSTNLTDEKLNDGEFGSFLLKSRTESMSSDTSEESGVFTISPEEREKIEEQMKRQKDHPIVQQIDIEAEELRREHDRIYHRSNSGMRRLLSRSMFNNRSRFGARGGFARGRNWNDIVRAFEQNYGEDRVQTLDDLVMLEAAIVLSMEQEAAQRRARGGNVENTGGAEHLRAGFPMLQALMERRAAEAASQQNEGENTNSDENHMARFERRRRERRNRRGWFLDNNSETAAMHSLSLRDVSEEQQMEMAIAASLADSQAPIPDSNGSSNNNTGNTVDQVNATEISTQTQNTNHNADVSSAEDGREATGITAEQSP